MRGLPAEMPPFPSTGPQGHRGRMREKLLERGPEALADYELLEMLLFFAFKTGDTKPLAKALINRYGSFAAVLAAPPRELLEARGLGPHSVSAIKLVQASALRLARAEVMERPVLNNWERLVDYLTAALARERVEQVRVLFLDPRNRLIADEALGKGTVNHTPDLSARGGETRAGGGRDGDDPRPQPSERRPHPVARRRGDDGGGEGGGGGVRHRPARPPHRRQREADLLAEGGTAVTARRGPRSRCASRGRHPADRVEPALEHRAGPRRIDSRSDR